MLRLHTCVCVFTHDIGAPTNTAAQKLDPILWWRASCHLESLSLHCLTRCVESLSNPQTEINLESPDLRAYGTERSLQLLQTSLHVTQPPCEARQVNVNKAAGQACGASWCLLTVVCCPLSIADRWMRSRQVNVNKAAGEACGASWCLISVVCCPLCIADRWMRSFQTPPPPPWARARLQDP